MIKNKKLILGIAIIALVSGTVPVVSADTGISINDNDFYKNEIKVTDEFKDYIEKVENGEIDKTERVPMAFDFDGTHISGNAENIRRYIPKNYDPRKSGKITEIRDQQNLGLCWAFAGIAGMESHLATVGKGKNDLSEEHLRWWAKKGINNWDIGDMDGTSNMASMSYLVSGDGPKLESELKYNTHNSMPSNINTAKGIGYSATDTIFIKNNRNDIKNAIAKYGAVVSGYGHFDLFASRNQNSYYAPEDIGQNHSITIVGWDDNYSRNNFNGVAKPKYNGAWLAKNSWGPYNSEGGYLWISYEDKTLFNAFDNYAIKSVAKSGNRIYQHEKGAYLMTQSKKCAMANVFNFKGKNESIEGVIIGNAAIGTKYELYYAPVKNGVPENNNLKLLSSGVLNETGYITIPVKSVRIPSGNGAIVIKMENKNNAKMFVESNLKNVPWFKAKAKKGESFILENGKFEDVNADGYDALNFTIKAITKDNNSPTPKPNPNDIIGSNRYDTAIKTSQRGWSQSDVAIITNGNAIVDALSATPLASYENAPILLTEKNNLKDNIKNELKRLGAKRVYIIGGESVISPNVEYQIRELGINVERIFGENRYETSISIANEMKKQGVNIDEVAVVNGVKGLSDAISFGAAAGQNQIPIILADKKGKTPGAEEILSNESIEKTYIIGGDAVIPESIEYNLKNPERISGLNRRETNAEIIKKFYNQSNLEYLFVVKDGSEGEDKLIDGLSVGALAAKTKSPIVLAGNTLSNGQKNSLQGKKVNRVAQVGGGSNYTVANQLRNLFK